MSSIVTVSLSGTAWLRDTNAQGKSPGTGWASSPDAAYYASLDTDDPIAKPGTGLPSTMIGLLKLHSAATDDQDGKLAEQTRQKILGFANANAISSSGNIIDVKA
jgi:hypothetical protein